MCSSSLKKSTLNHKQKHKPVYCNTHAIKTVYPNERFDENGVIILKHEHAILKHAKLIKEIRNNNRNSKKMNNNS